MEKKNTLVITILAVVVLLVLVLTATFAYFAANISGNGNTGNVINVNATLPKADTTFIVTTNGALAVNTSSQEMAQTAINNTVYKEGASQNLMVNLTGGTSDSETEFTYNLYFAWDTASDAEKSYIYATPGMTDDGINKEITLAVAASCNSTTSPECDGTTKTTLYTLGTVDSSATPATVTGDKNIASTTNATASTGLNGLLAAGSNSVKLNGDTPLKITAAGKSSIVTYTAYIFIYNTGLDQSKTYETDETNPDANYKPIAGKSYTGKIYVDDVTQTK